MTQPLLQAADLRGAARLSTDAVASLTCLVEAMQAGIAAATAVHGRVASNERERGLPGLVFKSVRGVTHLADASADALLGWLGPALAPADVRQPPAAEPEAIRAALNGLLGDHLAATGDPLAIAMAFRHAGRPLPLDRFALRSRLPDATPRLLVLLHGLCMDDLQWQRAGHDHGAALAQELGYTPIYLHYNSGLSISTNGRVLAQQMERLFDAWPVPLARLVMLGHGMGGLVARSALHHAPLIQRGSLRWTARVNDLVCLGTPHGGAPLDREGHGIELLLAGTPYAAPLARLGKVRSAGINDLRHGNVLSGEVGDPEGRAHAPVILPAALRCFAVAGSLGTPGVDLASRLPGDGLVPVASALGRDRQPERRVAIAEERQAVVHETGHLELLSSAQVFGLLRQWLQ